MTKKSRLLPTLAFAIAAALGVYLGHVNKASAEKCNPKDSSTCVGGPTGPEPTCGVRHKPCCVDALNEELYCTDLDLRCEPNPNNPQQTLCDF